jgi:ribosome-associated protein
MAALLETIVEAIDDKLGKDIISLDLSLLDGAICDTFVVCSAGSPTQTSAIADGVEETVEKVLGRRVLRSEGKQVGEWVVMDYGEIMVHIFLTEKRDFYNLEALWADGELKRHTLEN